MSSFPLPERFFISQVPKFPPPPVETIEEKTSKHPSAEPRQREGGVNFFKIRYNKPKLKFVTGGKRGGVFVGWWGVLGDADFPPSTARDVPHKLTPFLSVTWNCCGPYKTLRVNWKRPYKLKHCLTSCSLFHYSHLITCVYDSVFSMFFRTNTKGSPLHTCREGFAIEKGELELNDGFQKFHKCLWHSTGKLRYIEHYPWSAYVKT